MSEPTGTPPGPQPLVPVPRPDAAPPPEDEPPLLEPERLPPRPERSLAPRAVRVAWVVALAADGIQWIVWPLFIAGAASPLTNVLDVVVAAVMIRLLGWHWAFLPTIVAELLPGVDLVPTWTAAVFLATRGRRAR